MLERYQDSQSHLRECVQLPWDGEKLGWAGNSHPGSEPPSLLLHPFAFSGLFPPPCGIAAGMGIRAQLKINALQTSMDQGQKCWTRKFLWVSSRSEQQNKHHGAKGFGSPQDADPGRNKESMSSSCPWLSGLERGQQHREQIPSHRWRSAGWEPCTPSDVSDPLLNNSSAP